VGEEEDGTMRCDAVHVGGGTGRRRHCYCATDRAKGITRGCMPSPPGSSFFILKYYENKKIFFLTM